MVTKDSVPSRQTGNGRGALSRRVQESFWEAWRAAMGE